VPLYCRHLLTIYFRYQYREFALALNPFFTANPRFLVYHLARSDELLDDQL
jgi:hypothetical protein